MGIDGLTLLTICGMAAVTYATRAFGYWMADRLTISPRMKRVLGHVPGTVLISIVAPAAARGGPAEAIAIVATAVTALRSKNLLVSMAVGVVTVWLLRTMWG